MTWEIVVGIITLIGVFGTVAGWSWKMSAILAKLQATIDVLNKTLDTLQNNNNEEHEEIYKQLEEHEHRLIVIEAHDELAAALKH